MKIVKFSSVFIFLISLTLSSINCGLGSGEKTTEEPSLAAVTVRISGYDGLPNGNKLNAKPIPANVASIVLKVKNASTSEIVQTKTINITWPQEEPSMFAINLDGGVTYDFVASAYSSQNEGGALLYKGTVSGVSISWGSNIILDIYLGIVGISPPSVTISVTDILKDSVTLTAQITPNGYETAAYFEWGTDIGYGNTTPIRQIGAGTSPVSISQSLNGLTFGITYDFRLTAINSGNIVNKEGQFVTVPVDTYFSLAVTENSHNHAGAKLLFLDFQGLTPDPSVIRNNIIISPKVSPGIIVLDGGASDWNVVNLTTVKGLVQNNYPLSKFIDAVPTDITVGSTWDENHIYFLLQWEDAGHTSSTQLGKWIYGDQGNSEIGWNSKVHSSVTPGAPNENAVNALHIPEGAEDEDRILIMFPIIDGENNFTGNGLGCAAYCHANLKSDTPSQNYTGMGVSVMHANLIGDKADIWHWKSIRTAPAGYSDDKKLIYASGSENGRASDSGSAAYSGNSLIGGNPEFSHKNGLSYTGDSLFLQDAISFAGSPVTGDQIPSIISVLPSGSRGDIEASEFYNPVTHLWTVELKRRLDTGNDDDHQFTAGSHTAPPSSTAVSTSDPVAGEGLYNNYCNSCHSANGVGIVSGNSWSFPPLQRAPSSLILKAIKTVGVMSDLSSLTRQNVENIAAFLQTKATFAATNTLSVNINGVTGTGVVTSSNSIINCPNTCSFDYKADSTVTLTANNVQGYTFTGWSGGSCGGTGTCAVTMSGDQSVTANYIEIAAPTNILTVTKSGNGTITGSPTGIDCGSVCTEAFPDGTSITLTATPSQGYGFIGWGGGVCSGTGQCTFIISADTTVTASFTTAATATCTNGGVTFDVGGTNDFGLQQVINAGTVTDPTDLAFIPVSGGFLVTAQSGLVYYFNGGCNPINSIDLRSASSGGIGVVSGGEQGLLNVEFHPGFSTNGYVFFYHTSVLQNTNSVSRMTLSFDINSYMVLSDPVKIIDFKKPSNAGNHNGGGLVFAPDNTMLASVGDGGAGNSANGQRDTNLLGSVLRIAPNLADGTGGYTIPTGNMFNSGNPSCSNVASSVSPCPEILAKGLRNPYRMSIDANIVYLGDVGARYEELDSFDYTDNTMNFGWPTYDGTVNQAGYRDPVLVYNRNDATSNLFRSEDPMIKSTGFVSIIIGEVYRGSLYGGQLTGRLFHTEFMDGYTRTIGVNAAGNRTDMGIHIIHHDGISAMINGPDDYVYIATQGGAWGTIGPDMIYRLVKP